MRARLKEKAKSCFIKRVCFLYSLIYLNINKLKRIIKVLLKREKEGKRRGGARKY